MTARLLVEDLGVEFATPAGTVRAVEGLSFALEAGRTLGIVGESGAGKSQAMLALMGLLPRNARVTGRALLDGTDLLSLPPAAHRRFCGRRIAMVFQDPFTALNPYRTVGAQLREVLAWHEGVRGAPARARCKAMLEEVGIAEPERRLAQYPHELSGGMRQRVLLAMALAARPDVLIADEPTTALDVTVQAQVLALLRETQRARGLALVFITHDLGVVAQVADEVLVMYGGRTVERAPAAGLFARPCHPYTRGLLACLPRLAAPPGTRCAAIPGAPPDPRALPAGCAFAPRCAYRFARCETERPRLRPVAAGHEKACHLDDNGH